MNAKEIDEAFLVTFIEAARRWTFRDEKSCNAFSTFCNVFGGYVRNCTCIGKGQWLVPNEVMFWKTEGRLLFELHYSREGEKIKSVTASRVIYDNGYSF